MHFVAQMPVRPRTCAASDCSSGVKCTYTLGAVGLYHAGCGLAVGMSAAPPVDPLNKAEDGQGKLHGNVAVHTVIDTFEPCTQLKQTAAVAVSTHIFVVSVTS